jgi:hypothetical protein
MPTYGRTTAGASFQEIEIDVQAITITLPGGEPIVATKAYLRGTNGSTCNVKSVLYNTSDGLVYQSDQLSFTDDVGGWKTITWPATTPAAGTYLLAIGGGPISGGLNTVELAYDTVAASSNYRRSSSATGGSLSTYPAFPNPITWDGSTDTHDASLYLETSSASNSLPAKVAFYRMMRNN